MGFAVDGILPPGIEAARAEAKRQEELGFDGLWTAETQSDPLLDLAAVAVETTKPVLGTNLAIAFARSPFVTAIQAWQLQKASKGRFILGLGTQVKGHITRRFGMPWESPGPKFREYIEAVKALFRAFQREEPLSFQGKFYTHTLITPFFDPGPMDFPAPPVMIAAINEYNCETVGRVADGLLVHPLNSPTYIEGTIMPAIQRGLDATGRSRKDITIVCPVFIVPGKTKEERADAEMFVRMQIAFYGSTRTYAPVFEAHGWDDVPPKLHRLMAEGDVEGMGKAVHDEIIETIAVVGPEEEIAAGIRARYGGIADRIYAYNLFGMPLAQDPAKLRAFLGDLRA